MNFEEFRKTYYIVLGEPQTINPNKINVQFNKRRAYLVNKESQTSTPLSLVFDDIQIDENNELIIMQEAFKYFDQN